MASRYEVDVTVGSARDLKNVNWRNGSLKAYVVLWIDDGSKCSTRVDLDNSDNPVWDEKVTVHLPPGSTRLDDAVLYLDVVHANAADGVKPLVGSARLPLRDVLDDGGVGAKVSRTIRLKRPSGRPQGKLDARVAVKEPSRYDPSPYPAPGYTTSRDRNAAGGYGAGGAYGSGGGGYGVEQPYNAAPPAAGYTSSYGAAPPSAGYPLAYGAAPPPAGYPSAYGAAPPPAGFPSAYGSAPPPQAQPAFGAPTAVSAAPPPEGFPSAYGSAPPPQAQPAFGAPTAVGAADPAPDPNMKKKNKMGMGKGAAVGAAGLLGGLALVGGASYLEHRFEDHVAEKVEEKMEANRDREYSYDDDDDY